MSVESLNLSVVKQYLFIYLKLCQNTYLNPIIRKIVIKNEICDEKYIRIMYPDLFYERKHYVNEQTKSRDVPCPACPMTRSTVRRAPRVHSLTSLLGRL